MGCEGGSIPKRNELVKTKKATNYNTEQYENTDDSYYCPLSKKPLQIPIVADGLGRLYNKDAIIEALLDKKESNSSRELSKVVSSLNDVVNVKAVPNRSLNSTSEQFEESTLVGNIAQKNKVPRFMCPVTGKEMNGSKNNKFYIIWSCGCMFSEQALKMLPGDTCPSCEKNYVQEDLIPVNPTKPEIIDNLKKRLVSMRAKRCHVPDDQPNTLELQSQNHSSKYPLKAVSKKQTFRKKRERCMSDNVNLPIPNVTKINNSVSSLISKSEAVNSLYKNKKPKNETYLTMGTFNRFPASF